MKKWWVKLPLVLAALILVLSILVTTSSFHSKNAVEVYKDKLRAAGEKIDIKDLMPPLVDSGSNGLVLLNKAFRYVNSGNGMLQSNAPTMMQMVALGKAMVGWQQSQVVSVHNSYLVTNSWDDAKWALQPQAPAFDWLRQAAECPRIDFGLDYTRDFPSSHMNDMSRLKGAILVLSYQSAEALHRGDSAEAVTNVHTLVNLIKAWNEPIPVSQSVRTGMAFVAMFAQWELLQATNLTDEQLALLQRDWVNLDFIAAVEKGMMISRAWTCMQIEQWRSSNSPSAAFAGSYGSPSARSGFLGNWFSGIKDLGDDVKRQAVDTLWRVSWSYSDELTVIKADQVLVETTRQIETNGYFEDAFRDRDRRLAALGLNRTNRLYVKLSQLGAISVQSLSSSLNRLLMAETLRKLTITSIALKRYELLHGEWPPDLNALVPKFLPAVPRDPMDGRPLRYRWNPDKTFTLYSIGADGVDNGGDPSRPTPSLTWQNGRDWVWPQPATPLEIQNYYDHPPK